MNFVKAYVEDEYKLLQELDSTSFHQIIEIFKDAYIHNRQIFLMGNGGSAATCNHFVGDLSKNAIVDKKKKRFRIISLSQSPEMISMYGNDIAFSEVFKEQLVNLLQKKDVLISVSASGSSPNLLAATSYAKEREAKIVSLAGFNGGKMKDLADLSIPINSNVYEIIEDMHLIIFHMIVTYFKKHPDVLQT